jgi:hypothetical protein
MVDIIKPDKQFQLLFQKQKYLIIIEKIFEFFDLEEIFKLSNINSHLFKYVTSSRCTNKLSDFKKLKLNNAFFSDIEQIEKFLHEEFINIDDLNFNEAKVEYFALYLFKNYFNVIFRVKDPNEMNITKLNDSSLLPMLLHYYTSTEVLKAKYKELFYYNNNLSPEKNSLLINSFLRGNHLDNILSLSFLRSNLTDINLPPVIKFLKNDRHNLRELYLSYNNIGQTETGLELLNCIATKITLSVVGICNCLYDSKALPYIVSAYENKHSKVESFNYQLLQNNFQMNDIQMFMNSYKPIKNNNFIWIGLSLKNTPSYFIRSDCRELIFSKENLDEYELNANPLYYQKYIESLNFDKLNIRKYGDDGPVQEAFLHVIENIIDNKLITHLEVYYNNIPNSFHQLFRRYIQDSPVLKYLQLVGRPSVMSDDIRNAIGLSKTIRTLKLINSTQDLAVDLIKSDLIEGTLICINILNNVSNLSEVADAFKTNTKITKLVIEEKSQFSDNTLNEFISLIVDNYSLLSVDISGASDEFNILINDICKRNLESRNEI